MTRVLVTGATGFIGRALCGHFAAAGVPVRRALRRPAARAGSDDIVVGDIDGTTDWADALSGVDSLVHLAGRVHMIGDDSPDPMAEYRRVNVDGARNLAAQAAAAGVRRFVYVSSIKVNGEATQPGQPFRPSDHPAPTDPYGISKLEAEAVVCAAGAESGMEIVIVRPPLVYGPGVGANFLRLLTAIHRRYPMPLGRVDNARSLIYIGNLVDLLHTCVVHPDAPGQVFLASDGPPLSTPQLIRAIADAMGRTPFLPSVPVPMLRAAGKMTGRSAAVDRLLGSLVVDDSATGRTLDWSPPFTAAEGFSDTTRWYLGDERETRT